MFWRTRIEDVELPTATETTTIIDQPTWVPWIGAVNLWLGMAIGAVTALLAVRLGLQVGSANPGNSFVDGVYDVTGAMIHPFHGIFAVHKLNNGGIFEPATVVAGAVYLAAAIAIMLLLWAAAASTAKSVYTSTRSTNFVHGH
jgi:hypothetical protein